jgi:Tfp pilus assembly pilus retraction ATPase PilT
MLVGQETTGMVTFNQSLLQLVRDGVVSPEEAVSASQDPDDLIKGMRDGRRLVQGG